MLPGFRVFERRRIGLLGKIHLLCLVLVLHTMCALVRVQRKLRYGINAAIIFHGLSGVAPLPREW